MNKLTHAAAIASLVLAGSQAFAGDCNCANSNESGGSSSRSIDWNVSTYAGAGLQFSKFNEWSLIDRYDDGSFTAHSKTSDGAGFRLFGGINFLRYFGIEAGYTDSGEASSIAESDGSGSIWAAKRCSIAARPPR